MSLHHIPDPDMQLLERIANRLHEDYPDVDDRSWANSPFEWIKERASAQQGSICKRLVADALEVRGFSIARAPGRGADWEINGIRAAVKSSTLWEGRFYKFQQLRNQDYHVVICLGISPFDAHCWVIPRSFIMENWGVPELFPIQHRGQEGTDTVWITVDPENVQPSLIPYGGTLTEAAEVLSELSCSS